MTTHEVARALLARPECAMVTPGLGSDESFWFEVKKLIPDKMKFDTCEGKEVEGDCVYLDYESHLAERVSMFFKKKT